MIALSLSAKTLHMEYELFKFSKLNSCWRRASLFFHVINLKCLSNFSDFSSQNFNYHNPLHYGAIHILSFTCFCVNDINNIYENGFKAIISSMGTFSLPVTIIWWKKHPPTWLTSFLESHMTLRCWSQMNVKILQVF